MNSNAVSWTGNAVKIKPFMLLASVNLQGWWFQGRISQRGVKVWQFWQAYSFCKKVMTRSILIHSHNMNFVSLIQTHNKKNLSPLLTFIGLMYRLPTYECLTTLLMNKSSYILSIKFKSLTSQELLCVDLNFQFSFDSSYLCCRACYKLAGLCWHFPLLSPFFKHNITSSVLTNKPPSSIVCATFRTLSYTPQSGSTQVWQEGFQFIIIRHIYYLNQKQIPLKLIQQLALKSSTGDSINYIINGLNNTLSTDQQFLRG